MSRTLLWIGRIGWALFLVWAVALLAWGFLAPEPYAGGWRLVLELAFLGRLVNIADGIANGFSSSYLLVQSGVQDVILLLIAYPWVVAAYEGSTKKGFFSGSIDRVRSAAEKNRRFVEPLGVIGLWGFVFFPFWSTGALVGGVVGYLLGIRTWLVFASVLAGHVLSVVSLIWFFDSMRGFLERIDQGLIRFLPWFVLGLLAVGSLIARGLKSNRQSREA